MTYGAAKCLCLSSREPLARKHGASLNWAHSVFDVFGEEGILAKKSGTGICAHAHQAIRGAGRPIDWSQVGPSTRTWPVRRGRAAGGQQRVCALARSCGLPGTTGYTSYSYIIITLINPLALTIDSGWGRRLFIAISRSGVGVTYKLCRSTSQPWIRCRVAMACFLKFDLMRLRPPGPWSLQR